MSRLTGKISRRIMAFVLSLAMIMPNMTAYAGELNMPQTDVQADINTDTDVVTVDITEETEDTSGASEDGAASEDDGVADDAADESGEDGAVSDETGDDSVEPDGTEEGDVNDFEDEADADETDELGNSVLSEELDEEGDNTSKEEYTEPHKFVSAELSATDDDGNAIEDKTTFAEGTAFADGYFKVVGNVMHRINNQGKTDCVETGSKGSGSIQFTVRGTANVALSVSSNGNSNTSYVALAKIDGQDIDNNESTTEVTGKDHIPLTYTALTAGTYKIYSYNGTDSNINKRGVQIHSIDVTETVTRTKWDKVQPPTVTAQWDSAEGKINVTVSADVSIDGGDRVEVEMYEKVDGGENDVLKEHATIRTVGEEFNLSFNPSKSGTYYFIAKLQRYKADGKETNDIASDKSAEIIVSRELAAPANLQVVEKDAAEGISVEFSWGVVEDADRYSVEVTQHGAAADAAPVYKNENVSKETTRVTINSGLERGKTYIFSVSAVRIGTGEDAEDETAASTIIKKISSNEAVTKDYVFSPIEFEDINTGAIADGTIFGTDVYFKAAILHKDGTIQNEGQFVRIRQKAQAGIQFTVEGTADVVISAASTGGNNTSWAALWDNEKNAAVAEKDNKKSVYGTTAATLTYKGVTAGTYTVLTPDDGSDGNRDIRLHSITVTETSTRAERMEFDLVNKPVVESVTEGQDGEISVEVSNALLGYDGGDRLLVVLENENGKEISGIKGVSALPGSTHTVKLNISSCETGNYTVRAKLVRGVGEDKQELKGDVTQSLTHMQDLKNPENLYVTNKGQKEEGGSGSVWLSWKAAYGAKYYIIEVIDESNVTRTIKTANANTSYLIDDALTVGSKYTFKVYGAREVDNVEHKSDVPAVEENYEIIAGEGDASHAEGNYVLQISRDTGYFGESTKQDGEMYKTGDDKFFTMIYNSSSKVESNTKKFEDGKEETGRLSFNSAARTTGGSIKFTVTAASRVTIYWQAAGDGREMQILDADGKEVKSTNIGTTKNDLYISKLYLDDAGTYYLGGKGGNNFIFRVEVDNGYTRTRPAWNTVALPDMEVKQVKDSIEVSVKAKIGSEGNDAEADKVEVTMYDENGEVAGNVSTTSEGIDPVLVIKPEASGKYRFKAALSRDDEPDDVKYSEYPVEEDEFFQYTHPLNVPELNDVKNMGAVDEAKKHGSVELSWGSVKEADRYIVRVEGKDTDYQKEYSVTSPAILIDEGLDVNSTYIFKVCAQRDATGTFDDEGKLVQPETTEYAVKEAKIAAEYKADWNFVVYGIGTSTDASGFVAADGTKASDSKTTKYSSKYVLTERDGTTPKETVEPSAEGLEGDDVRVWTWGGKGKIVPADTDGLAFYYTTVNPQTTNFTLSANLHVNHWRIGNGQEGFGLLAADRIGENGNTAYHWTNSYTALASKFDYYWDSTNGKVSDSGTKVTLKLGIGSTAKTGVTAANLSVFQNDVTTATTSYYKTETLPLDTSVHTDIYDNIIANENLGSTKSVPNPIEDFKLEIDLNATGYFISYIPLTKNADGTFTEGTKVTNKYYDRNALSMCEENVAYVGFFATRYADVTFSDVKLDTRRYDPTEEPEERPAQEVQLKASVSGASTANNEDYNLVYSANWKGIVSIRDESGALLKQESIEPREGDLEEEGRVVVPVKLHVGDNTFQVTFTPDKDYDPYNGEPFTRLTSYDSKVSTVKVTWKQYGKEGEILYVSPSGKATGDGTKINPLDIYTAVKYAQPGQTIYLMGGTYKLTKTVKIDRGINGTKDKMIYMLADPETCKDGVRPVFDFNSQCAGLVVAGDWWYYQGFDVTKSANQTKGIQVSGNHNTLDGIHIYKNGSTGLQISRLYSSDKTIDEWPSYNLILNCTACLNADAGYTDADGFAAKLTVGYGNVFDGCLSAYNADDGWDLFAKVWTGPIGVVTIQNCVSFENGKVIREKKTNDLVWFNESDDYEIVNAGSGNGFKMGGSSITGYHTIINSVAFHNKSKGIDCNSCPDIQVYNSISYDNESYNIAMYSNAAVTDFKATGFISYRSKVSLSAEDRIGTKSDTTPSTIVNTQEDCVEKIFNNTNYLWNKYSMVSEPGRDFYEHYTTWTTKNAKPPVTSTTVSDDWFKDLDYETWVTTYCPTIGAASRDADGTINLHGFLELTDKGKAAMEATGAEGSFGLGKGQVSQDANDFLDKVTGGETGGNINTGDAGGEKDDNMDYDDFTQMPGNADEVDLWIAVTDRNKAEYTGRAVKPEIHVYSGTKLLKKGKDYTVTYKNNINAYVGAYDEAYYSRNAGIYQYSGVTFDELKDSYKNIGNDKKPTIIIRAKGNYKNYNTQNVTQVYFDINPVSLTNDAMNRIGMNDIALVAKSGRQQSVNPVVTFNNSRLSSVRDKDYSFKVYSTDSEGKPSETAISDSKVSTIGLYKVEITGKNNFAGIKTIDLNVVGDDQNVLASNFKLKPGTKIPDKYREGYNAIAVDEEIPLPVELSTSELVLVDKNGKELTKDEDYRLSYKNNIDIGTATVIVTGISSKDAGGKLTGYVGSKEFKFRIVAPTLNKMLKDKDAKLIDILGLDYGKGTDGMLKITTPESQFKLFGDNHTYQYEGKAVDPVNEELVDTSNNKAKLGLAVKRGNDWYLLVQDKDYKLSYTNNTRQGNASAVFKGVGNYRGSVVQKFKITPFDLDDVNNRMPGDGENVSKIGGTFEIKRISKSGEDAYVGSVFEDGYNAGTQTYTGMKVEYEKGGVRPTVSIRINGNLLKAGRDYSVTYKNNSKVTAANTAPNRMPTIIIRGRNGLKGTLTGTFTISKKSFDSSENRITVTASDVRISRRTNEGYTGSYKTRIVVKDAKGRTLSAGSDYDSNKIKYELVNNNSYETIKVLSGSDMVTIKNNDNDQYLTIKVTVYPSGGSQYYEGGEAGISTYYRVLYTKNSLRTARYEVNYSAAAEDDTCLYEATADKKAFYYYEDGINLNSSLLTVKLDGKELVWGEDFEVVKYVGNDKQGTAKLTIQGKGKYFDTKVITFRIVPKDFKWWQKPVL